MVSFSEYVPEIQLFLTYYRNPHLNFKQSNSEAVNLVAIGNFETIESLLGNQMEEIYMQRLVWCSGCVFGVQLGENICI